MEHLLSFVCPLSLALALAVCDQRGGGEEAQHGMLLGDQRQHQDGFILLVISQQM